jgi:hypothetical protein
VPVEEPSTASKADIRIAANLLFDHDVTEHLVTVLVLVAELTVDAGTEIKWRAIMDIHSAQLKFRPIAAALLLGLALTFASWPAAAQ